MSDHQIPRVYIASGTPEEVAKQMQQAIREDGRVMPDGRPPFDIVATTQSPSGDRLTVIAIYRAEVSLL